MTTDDIGAQSDNEERGGYIVAAYKAAMRDIETGKKAANLTLDEVRDEAVAQGMEDFNNNEYDLPKSFKGNPVLANAWNYGQQRASIQEYEREIAAQYDTEEHGSTIATAHQAAERSAVEGKKEQGQSVSAESNQQVSTSQPTARDHVRELLDQIGQAAAQPPQQTTDVPSSIQRRTELHTAALVQAKQAAIDAAGKDAAPAERLARQDEELRRPVEALPPEMIRQLAEVDARDFRKLTDPQQQTEAAVAMAEVARMSPGYRAAVADTGKDVSEVVQVALDAIGESKATNRNAAPGLETVGPRGDAINDETRAPAMSLDPAALERVAANRARDLQQVSEQLGINGVEQAIEQKRQAGRDAEVEEMRAAVKSAAKQPESLAKGPKAVAGDNQVTSDEVFTAEKPEVKPIIPAEVEEKYLRVGSKFYHPQNTELVAFEDRGNKLETRSNSEQIAEAMVTIARARGWDEIKVSGTETFRKEVWLEAAAHGMHVKGYTPSEVDKAELAKRTKDIDASNRVEPDSKFRGRENDAEPTKPAKDATALERDTATARPDLTKADKATESTKEAPEATVGDRQSAQKATASNNSPEAEAFILQTPAEAVKAHPQLAGAYAAMASVEKQVANDGLNPEQREIVMQRVRANLVNSIERGEIPEPKVRETIEVRREVKAEQEITR